MSLTGNYFPGSHALLCPYKLCLTCQAFLSLDFSLVMQLHTTLKPYSNTTVWFVHYLLDFPLWFYPEMTVGSVLCSLRFITPHLAASSGFRTLAQFQFPSLLLCEVGGGGLDRGVLGLGFSWFVLFPIKSLCFLHYIILFNFFSSFETSIIDNFKESIKQIIIVILLCIYGT